MRIKLSIFLFFLSFFSLGAKELKLSEQSQISLITYGPGSEVYSIFGHSAIRVKDPVNKIDYTYNYGTFDFSTEYFYLKFVRGNLNYFLTINDFRRAVPGYKAENRFINEMVLNFNYEQKQKLYHYLTENYKPENRYYKYDFFFDNCATRIRDMLIMAVDSNYKFAENSAYNSTSYRKILKPYIVDEPWLDLGINLALGLPADEISGVWGSMYLPDYLKEGFESAYIISAENEKPYISKQNSIYEQKVLPKDKSLSIADLFSPIIVFNLILILTLIFTYYEYKRRLNLVWFDKILFGIIGFLGLVLVLLWLGTEHDVMNSNLNILWAMPLHVVIIWTFNKNKLKKFHFYYFLINGIILFSLLILWSFFPQDFHNYLLPLVVALMLRSIAKVYYVIRFRRNVQLQ